MRVCLHITVQIIHSLSFALLCSPSFFRSVPGYCCVDSSCQVMVFDSQPFYLSKGKGTMYKIEVTRLEDPCLHSADGHCPDATNLVDILQRQAQGLVCGARGGEDGVQGLQKYIRRFKYLFIVHHIG